MKILDRYIARTVIVGTLTVLMVLSSVFAFIDFVSEVDNVGRANYNLIDAGAFVLLRLPKHFYELFPTSVLIGSILSLGTLAGNSELTVMRASGISVMRIVYSVLKAGVVLLICVALNGELVVPVSERQAQILKAKKLHQNISLGKSDFWARDKQRFLYVSHVFPGINLGKVKVYEFSDNNQLKRITIAESAKYRQGQWYLEDVKQTDFADNQLDSREKNQLVWKKLLDPDLFNVVSEQPGNMSAFDLYRYNNYLKNNELDSSRYELAFWIKIFTPISSLVMLLIALPFVFSSQRSAGTGNRVMMGLLLGIGFYLLNRTINHLGQVYQIYPFISASAPVIFVAMVSLLALRKVK